MDDTKPKYFDLFLVILTFCYMWTPNLLSFKSKGLLLKIDDSQILKIFKLCIAILDIVSYREPIPALAPHETRKDHPYTPLICVGVDQVRPFPMGVDDIVCEKVH